MDTFEKVYLGVAIAVVVLLTGLIGLETGRNIIRKEALLLGHAHYAYDSNGVAIFKWSECIQMHWKGLQSRSLSAILYI